MTAVVPGVDVDWRIALPPLIADRSLEGASLLELRTVEECRGEAIELHGLNL
jgi:hypothetical protein